MTAIELLAAAALAAALMVAVLGVLGSLARRQNLSLANTRDPQWQTGLERAIRWDFANARRAHWQPDEIRLIGFGSRDPADGLATHGLAEVLYSIRQIGNRNWLVRTERDLASRTLQNSRSELVCSGAGEFQLEGLEDGDFPPRREFPVPAGIVPCVCLHHEAALRFVDTTPVARDVIPQMCMIHVALTRM